MIINKNVFLKLTLIAVTIFPIAQAMESNHQISKVEARLRQAMQSLNLNFSPEQTQYILNNVNNFPGKRSGIEKHLKQAKRFVQEQMETHQFQDLPKLPQPEPITNNQKEEINTQAILVNDQLTAPQVTQLAANQERIIRNACHKLQYNSEQTNLVLTKAQAIVDDLDSAIKFTIPGRALSFAKSVIKNANKAKVANEENKKIAPVKPSAPQQANESKQEVTNHVVPAETINNEKALIVHPAFVQEPLNVTIHPKIAEWLKAVKANPELPLPIMAREPIMLTQDELALVEKTSAITNASQEELLQLARSIKMSQGSVAVKAFCTNLRNQKLAQQNAQISAVYNPVNEGKQEVVNPQPRPFLPTTYNPKTDKHYDVSGKEIPQNVIDQASAQNPVHAPAAIEQPVNPVEQINPPVIPVDQNNAPVVANPAINTDEFAEILPNYVSPQREFGKKQNVKMQPLNDPNLDNLFNQEQNPVPQPKQPQMPTEQPQTPTPPVAPKVKTPLLKNPWTYFAAMTAIPVMYAAYNIVELVRNPIALRNHIIYLNALINAAQQKNTTLLQGQLDQLQEHLTVIETEKLAQLREFAQRSQFDEFITLANECKETINKVIAPSKTKWSKEAATKALQRIKLGFKDEVQAIRLWVAKRAAAAKANTTQERA